MAGENDPLNTQLLYQQAASVRNALLGSRGKLQSHLRAGDYQSWVSETQPQAFLKYELIEDYDWYLLKTGTIIKQNMNYQDAFPKIRVTNSEIRVVIVAYQIKLLAMSEAMLALV